MKNGVEIRDPASTYIDQDVTFGKNVLIYPNNIIYGKMEVMDNVTFYSGNLIGDSVVKTGAKILMSKVKKSVLLEESKVFGSFVEGSMISKNVDVRNGSKITNSILKDNVTAIGSTTFNAVIGENSVLNNMSSVISYMDERVVLGENVILGTNAIVQGGVVIGKNCTILPSCIVNEDIPSDVIYSQKIQKELRQKVK